MVNLRSKKSNPGPLSKKRKNSKKKSKVCYDSQPVCNVNDKVDNDEILNSIKSNSDGNEKLSHDDIKNGKDKQETVPSELNSNTINIEEIPQELKMKNDMKLIPAVLTDLINKVKRSEQAAQIFIGSVREAEKSAQTYLKSISEVQQAVELVLNTSSNKIGETGFISSKTTFETIDNLHQNPGKSGNQSKFIFLDCFKYDGTEAHVCRLINSVDVYISEEDRSMLLKPDSKLKFTSTMVAVGCMMAVCNKNYLKKCSLDGKIDGKNPLPKMVLDAIKGFVGLYEEENKVEQNASEEKIKQALRYQLWKLQVRKKKNKKEEEKIDERKKKKFKSHSKKALSDSESSDSDKVKKHVKRHVSKKHLTRVFNVESSDSD